MNDGTNLSVKPNPLSGFQALSDIAYAEAGLLLSPGKAQMIQSRLRHRLKALSIATLEEYCGYLRANENQDERKHMISALTTNVSSFFREPHHFDTLVSSVLPAMKAKLQRREPVRIWSAGCSNGQEAYTIAMQVLENEPSFATKNFKILATDVDPAVIRFAKDGVYSLDQVSGVPSELRGRYFSKTGRATDEASFAVCSELKDLITFKELNLIGAWPMRHKFDAIFCRNVVIYFDRKTQSKLWRRFDENLKPDGFVFVGHSERLSDSAFTSVGATTYAKTHFVSHSEVS